MPRPLAELRSKVRPAGSPRAVTGPVEAIRALRVVRRSALKARTQAANQIRDLIVAAPDQLTGR
jgi:hypothetical protein